MSQMENKFIKNSKILIIDDEPSNLSVIFEYLNKLDAEIMLLQEGIEAVKIAEANNPDIILLDIIMPDMSGFDICKNLKENKTTSDIPVIFMSSLTDTENIVEGFECGGIDYITKPIRKEELIARISNHLRISRTEKKLKKYYLEIKEINETKNKILSIISHDLRTPIGNIASFVDMILSDYDYYDTQKIKEYLDIIKLSTDSCYYLIDNLLKWGLLQKKQLEPKLKSVNLKNLVYEMVLFFSSSADKKNITLISEIHNDINLFADEEMTKTIIRNLTSNAIKFTKKYGEIKISASIKKDFVEISVLDNGVGINQEHLSKIFNKNEFLSTYGTENEKGSGLGLILCRDFTEKNGGRIWVESEPGKGSNFKFTLPLAK